MPKKFAVLLIVTAFVLSAVSQTSNSFDGHTWWDHVKVLADDNMEGRDTGSQGLRKAEGYVVDQLKKNGVQPAGKEGYYQAVKFVSHQIVEKESSAALLRDGKVEPLSLGDDVIFNTRIDLAPEVEAPLVFVGYGLTVPEKNYDDLAGLDVKRKSGRHPERLTSGNPGRARLSLSDSRGALESFAESGCNRSYLDSEPRFHGCALVTHSLEPHSPQYGSC